MEEILHHLYSPVILLNPIKNGKFTRYQLVSRISSIHSIPSYLGVFPSVHQEIACHEQKWRQALAVFVDSWMMKFVTTQPCKTLLWMYVWMIYIQPNISEWRYGKYIYIYIYVCSFHTGYTIYMLYINTMNIYSHVCLQYCRYVLYMHLCIRDISIIHVVSWHCGSLVWHDHF